jgi:hypothetical protein
MPYARLAVAFVIGLALGVVGSRMLSTGATSSPVDAGAREGAPVEPGAARHEGTDTAGHVAGHDAAPEPRMAGSPGASERLQELTKKNADLTAEVETLRAKVKEYENPPPADPTSFRFGLAKTTPVFNKAAWPELAEHVRELTKTLAGLPETIARGEQPSAALLAAITKHNMPLAAFAIQLSTEVGGTGPNGAYTHPAVVANLIRASLAAAGDPLTHEQEIAIDALGKAWAGEVAAQAAGYGPDALALEKTVAEVDAKQRFLLAVRGVLTDSQRSVLFDPATQGRVGLDLLSPGLVYVIRRPVVASDRAGLEAAALKTLLDMAGMPADAGGSLDWIAKRWVEEVPGALEPTSATSPDFAFPTVERVQAQARAQLRAMGRLLGAGTLTDAQARTLRDTATVFYPQLIAPK